MGGGLHQPQPRDRQDPNLWDVLYLDEAIPVDSIAKTYMIRDLQSWTRNYLLIPIRLTANVLLAIIMTVKRLLPFQFKNYALMHRSAAFFLEHFVSPEACFLIVRHLCIGSNIVNFLIDNGPDLTIEKSHLYPRTVADIAKNAFLDHDIFLYNFVLDYHEARKANPNWLEDFKQRGINYDSIYTPKIEVDVTKRHWLKFLDLESAIELFKVFYSLFLTSNEFARAVMSLQFDENFSAYLSAVTGDHRWNHVITNRHPLAPNSPFNAARDLFIHGMMTEYTHRYLEISKQMAIARGDSAQANILPKE